MRNAAVEFKKPVFLPGTVIADSALSLLEKLRAYALQDAGRDTVDANLDLGLPVGCEFLDPTVAPASPPTTFRDPRKVHHG